MHTVAETPTFTRQAEKLLDEAERREVIDVLAADPEAGDLIPGTGGIRKLRVALSGQGKRGGARVIYYLLDETIPVYALAIYAKARKIDLKPEEKRALSELAAAIKCAARRGG